MDATEARKAVTGFLRAIVKDIEHDEGDGILRNNSEYHWVYHVHLGRTYRKRHPFQIMDVDTEQPDFGGESQDLFPDTQPADPIPALWGGSGGVDEHSSPPGLLGTYHNPIAIPDPEDPEPENMAGTEACEVKRKRLHSILQQGRSRTSLWGAISPGQKVSNPNLKDGKFVWTGDWA